MPKWDPKARAGIFLGYEEMSKTYRVYDIETGQVVISRAVNFDESTFGLLSLTANEVVENLDYTSLRLTDIGPRQVKYKKTGKRKSRPSDEDEAARRQRTVRLRPGLEEASAPHSSSHCKDEGDEETKDYDKSTPPVFWHVSANADKTAADLLEPPTFKAAVSFLDYVHWRKAIHSELEFFATSQHVSCIQVAQWTTCHRYQVGL